MSNIKWMPPKETKWQKFTKQPHQMFFLASIVWSIIIMLYSALTYAGIQNGDFLFLHGIGLMYGIFLNAFLGFLITVIPRYTQGTAIAKKQYILLWFVYQIAVFIAIFINPFIGKLLLMISILMSGMIFLFTLYNAKLSSQHESVWLSLSFFVEVLVFAAHLAWGIDLAWYTMWFLILPIVVIVSTRMIPSFYSVYFQSPLALNSKLFTASIVILLWLIGLSKDNSTMVAIFSGLTFLYLLYYFMKLDIYRKAPPMVWILGVGFLWLPIGFLVLFIESAFGLYTLKMSFHIFMVGFVFTLLIGFGTRVILGHSGRPIEADKLTLFLFISTQVIVIFRLLASIFQIMNLPLVSILLYTTFVMWIGLFIIWLVRYGKTILGN